jgi:hypothetical protein
LGCVKARPTLDRYAFSTSMTPDRAFKGAFSMVIIAALIIGAVQHA